MAELRAHGSGSAQAVDDLTGTTLLGRFSIQSLIGAGGMGEVYRAYDTRLKRTVAVKRLAPRLRTDERYRQRFLKEAERASALNNPHIAGIYDVLEAQGELLLIMEYVEGTTLRERMRDPLQMEQFLEMAAQCADGLVAAHQTGVIHRDIKPENIMLTRTGQVKILDFGIAKRLPGADLDEGAGDATTTEGITGTPAYMAPEVLLREEADARSDIFSLGIVFYETLTGKHPFRGDNFSATAGRLLHEDPTPVGRAARGVPPELERAIGKMMAKNPAERYATAADLLVDLKALQRAPAVPLHAGVRAKRWLYPAVAGLFALVLLLSVPAVRTTLARWLGRPPVLESKILVVFPFRAIGGDQEAQSRCDGLTETLGAKLSQLTGMQGLQVFPLSAVRESNVRTAEDARKELGATLVLEGACHRVGDAARVTYSLIETLTLSALPGGEAITADASDPFALEDQVVESVLATLAIALRPAERTALNDYGTSEPLAYEYYLRGLGYLQNYQESQNVTSAETLFRRALEIDPAFALAYAGLGEAYWRRYEHSRDSGWVAQALEACQRAVELDENSAPVHSALGLVYQETGRYEEAVVEFERALELDRTSDTAYLRLASSYQALGRALEAEQTYRRAIQLRPDYWGGYRNLGVFFYNQGRFQEAAVQFAHWAELTPENVRAYTSLGAAYQQQGRWEEARRMYEKSLEVRPNYPAYSNLATLIFFRDRDYTHAARMFEQALEMDDSDYYVWGNLASAYYWAPGERDKARDAYQHAVRMGEERREVNPRDPELLSHLAEYYSMLNRGPEALRLLEQALTLAPNNVEIMFTAAEIYEHLGERERALEWIGKALAQGYSPEKVQRAPGLAKLRADTRFQAFQVR